MSVLSLELLHGLKVMYVKPHKIIVYLHTTVVMAGEGQLTLSPSVYLQFVFEY